MGYVVSCRALTFVFKCRMNICFLFACAIFVCVRNILVLIVEFKKYFNGNPFSSVIVHHCGDECECKAHPQPVAFLKRKMVMLLRHLHYRRAPRVPRVKEWTALCAPGLF